MSAESYGGHGGRGGGGGHGGAGGGPDGVSGSPGKPGEPGEPGEPARHSLDVNFLSNFPIASIVTFIVAISGFAYWIIGLEGRITLVSRDLTSFRENVLTLNTPLSQHVFANEARIGEIARIQQEVRATILSLDKNGTSQNRVLIKEIESMRSDISGQVARCNDLNRIVSVLQSDLIETKVRLNFVIDAMTPHGSKRDK